jgi:hypothetical protein
METSSRVHHQLTHSPSHHLEIIRLAKPITAAETAPQMPGERVRNVLPVFVRTPRMDRRLALPLGSMELDVVPHLHVAPEVIQRAAHDKVLTHACAGL